MSKYKKLWEYLKNNNKDYYELTFEEIEKIIDFKIDHSFLTYKKEALTYGYQVHKISLKEKKIIFVKSN